MSIDDTKINSERSDTEGEPNISPPVPTLPKINLNRNQILTLAAYTVAILFLGFIGKNFDVQVVDPWYTGIKLVEASRYVPDASKKKQMLDSGFKLLKTQEKLHPYHARIKYFIGQYYYEIREPDSALYYIKTAVKQGKGGIWNSFEAEAKEMVKSLYGAKTSKFLKEGKFLEADSLVNIGLVDYPNDLFLMKTKAKIFSANKNMDSSLVWFLKVNQITKSKDVEVLNNLGVIYVNKSDFQEAYKYFKTAFELNPKNKSVANNFQNISKKLEQIKSKN